MPLHARRKTTILRLITIVLLSIVWISSICTFILGFINVAKSSNANNSVLDFNEDEAISQMGASIGLISTVLTAIPLGYAVYKSIKPEKVSSRTIITGTHFPRWIGGLIWIFSSAVIAVSAVLTYERRALLDVQGIAISVLCFIIGTSTLMISLLILIKPKETIKLPSRRQFISFAVEDGNQSPKSDQMTLSSSSMFGEKQILDSPPRLESPILTRCHSVQRKRVDYFAYLFDDGITTPTATDIGHHAYTQERTPLDIVRGLDYDTWKEQGGGKVTAHDTCSSSLNEIMLPTIQFQDSLHLPIKPRSSSKPKMKKARIYDHKTGAIAMLPYESNHNSRVSF